MQYIDFNKVKPPIINQLKFVSLGGHLWEEVHISGNLHMVISPSCRRFLKATVLVITFISLFMGKKILGSMVIYLYPRKYCLGQFTKKKLGSFVI